MSNNTKTLPARDGINQSAWQSQPLALKTKISDDADLVYDVLIIGGGITGLTAALLLQRAGKKVALAEAHSIGFGTTGGTSAHINTFADTTYKEAESAFGKEGAQLFADAINEGFGIIKSNIINNRIDCDYESKVGYVYAETDDESKALQQIYDGAKAVGVPVAETKIVSTPVPFKTAIKFEAQAQFHPLKYLFALANAFVAEGGLICEHTKINSVEVEGDNHTAIADHRNIKAANIIYATHIPPGINSYSLRCAPYRSYVIGVKLGPESYPDALIYDSQEPYHYVRTHVINGQKVLIVGGNDHKTAHDDPEQAFNDLEAYVRKYYEVSSVLYKWSSQYYVPVDGLPYIGQMPEAAAGTYCATGYNGNGMMLGSIAGKILADLVQGKASRYEKIFSPSRLKPVAGFNAFVQENADVAYHFVADRFGVPNAESLKAIERGIGKVVEVDGNKIAAYCDKGGKVYALNPTCTHAGCIVNWNGEEQSWDCPCHGARFDIYGNVLTGPATKPLSVINVTND